MQCSACSAEEVCVVYSGPLQLGLAIVLTSTSVFEFRCREIELGAGDLCTGKILLRTCIAADMVE